MIRLNMNNARPGILVLALLLATILLASCSGDDPAAPVVTNNAPPAATIAAAGGGPVDGATDVALAVVLNWACSDPDGDALTYTVRFGTATAPPVVAADHETTSYTPAALVNGTTYFWQIVASDGGKSTASAVWSFTTVAAVSETVVGPNAPTGPAGGDVDDVLSYTVTGGTSSEGHVLEYRFDWDDGTMSDWTAAMPVTHAWPLAGSYDVTAQARCIEHPATVSSNSLALQVTIDGPENVTAPTMPTGPSMLEVNTAVAYVAFGANSSRGHTLEYQVDWGDGTFSDWAPSGSVSRTWTVLGDFDVRSQARCVEHPDVESPWSSILPVTVLGPETISTPDAPTGPATGTIDDTLQFNMTGAASSHADELDIRFDWGNGIITAWTNADWGATRWLTAGTYEVKVQARCHTHITILSEWSAATTVTISDPPAETVGTPDTPTGPATGETTSTIIFTTSTVTSSEGHLVAYVFDWGDGTDSGWVYNPYASHWFAVGTYDVRVKALCSAHPEYESAWSPTTQIVITEPAETITGFYMSPGIVDFAAIGEEVWVSCNGTQTNLNHTVEYRFDMNDGTITDWAASTIAYHTWTTAGIYTLRAQARCAEHTDVMTEWSPDSYAEEIQIYSDVETILPAELLPAIPVTRTAGVEYSYTVSSGTSMGHRFEARIDWGNGEVSDWVPQWPGLDRAYFDYTYMDSGIYEISGQARCIEHPDVISDWSPTTTITVPEFITRPTLSGDVTGTAGVPVSFLSEGAVSSEGHALEHRLQIGVIIGAYSASPAMQHTFPSPGTYSVRTRARCVEHPEIDSPLSETLTVVITE